MTFVINVLFVAVFYFQGLPHALTLTGPEWHSICDLFVAGLGFERFVLFYLIAEAWTKDPFLRGKEPISKGGQDLRHGE